MKLADERIKLECGKYAYISIGSEFKDGKTTVHIIDRDIVGSGVPIFDCFEEIQENIIIKFGANTFSLQFLAAANWYLYSKDSRVGYYKTIGGTVELEPFDVRLNSDFVEKAYKMANKKLVKSSVPSVDETYLQLSLFD